MAISAGWRPHLRRSFRGGLADPYLLYTATLVPVVLLVALAARREGEVALAIAMSVAAILLAGLLPRIVPRRWQRSRRIWPLVRLAIPLFYVAAAVQWIGGPALPLLSLFIPVVAGAAALGTFHGWATAAVASVIFLLPGFDELGTTAAVALRGITLAGTALIIAFGVRRIVLALEVTAAGARKAAAAARRHSRQVAGLDAVERLLATAGPTANVMDRVLDVVSDRLGYRFVSIYLGDHEHMSLVASRGYPNALPSFDPRQGVAGRVMRTRRLTVVPDVAADPDYVPGTIPAISLICAPLQVDGALLGLLNVEAIGRPLDAADRTLVGMVAGRLATAVALGRDRQELSARAEMAAISERFGRDVAATHELASVAPLTLAALQRLVRCDGTAVVVRDSPSGRYIVHSVAGDAGLAEGVELVPGAGPIGRAIADCQTVVEFDTGRTAHRTVVAVPLVHNGEVAGAALLARVGAEPFTSLELEGIHLLASSAALALANASLHAEVQELAIRDGLTGLHNRRYFDEAVDRIFAGRRRDRLDGRARPLSAILFDLDHFGAFNKEHGHQIGDDVLRTFGRILADRFRASDLVARYGGEEFVAVLDGAALDEAVAVAEEVREALSAQLIHADGHALRVTVSAGAGELDDGDPTRDALLRRADVALSMAKRAGRDRVVAA